MKLWIIGRVVERARRIAHKPPMRYLVPLAGAVVLAACVPAARPPEAPPTRVPPPVAALPEPTPPPASADWRDWPVTPGTWTYRRDERGSLALFGQPGTDAALTLRCDAGSRTIYLSRAGSVATPLTIRTSSTARTLTLQPTGGTPPYVAAALTARDPLLDAMAFSRGRFAAQQAGQPPLVVPAWAEIGRVIDDCRG